MARGRLNPGVGDAADGGGRRGYGGDAGLTGGGGDAGGQVGIGGDGIRPAGVMEPVGDMQVAGAQVGVGGAAEAGHNQAIRAGGDEGSDVGDGGRGADADDVKGDAATGRVGDGPADAGQFGGHRGGDGKHQDRFRGGGRMGGLERLRSANRR